MDLQAALRMFGLGPEATPADVETAYRGLRKPILKALNKHDEGEEPPELVTKLEMLETAFQLIKTSTPQPTKAPAATGAATGAADAAEEAGEQASREQGAGSGTGTSGATQGGSTRGSGRTAAGLGFVDGDVLLDRYEITARLSTRPEGDTYRAHDRVRGSVVAVKILAPELLRDPKQRVRLKRSLLAATFLNHAHLVRVLAVLELPGTYAVVMQLPEASTNLWELMYGAEKDAGRLDKEAVLRITRQALHALSYVHTLTPHATLRPESIWIDAAGNAKIADVGFADAQTALRDRRQSRTKLGTAYWAPEQYRGDLAVGDPCDQYALALIVYEILSGKPSVGRIEKIRGFRKDYPTRFTQALERALSSKAGRRFPSMDAFGEAALPDYEPERAAPQAVSRESLLVPALLMLAVFAGFVLSPLGKGAAEHIGDAVARWRSGEELSARSDLELRQLQAMSRRLAARTEALDDTSRAELERVGGLLADPKTPLGERPALRSALTAIVRQLVATSRRKALDTFDANTNAIEALASTGRRKAAAALAAAEAEVPRLDAPDAETRDAARLAFVRRHAAAEHVASLWRTQLARVLAAPELEQAYRALREADAALAIGDEAAAEGAYERVRGAMEELAPRVTEATALLDAFAPVERPAGIGVKLEAEEAAACFDAFVAAADRLTDDADLARVLNTARAEAKRTATARALVHEDGYWTLELAAGPRAVTFAGTWSGGEDTRSLTLRVVDDRVLPEPFHVEAGRGAKRPAGADLVALLGAAPRSPQALWSTRGSEAETLPKPAFEAARMIVRAGKRSVAGTLAGGMDVSVLVAARRFDVDDKDAFEAAVTVPGDALVTWLRGHAARGMQTGPGALLRVQVDGLAPRVHPIFPAAGATVTAGEDVTVRLLVYDSTLKTLEVGGAAQELRRDEVYKLLEVPLRAPAVGKLTLPVRAVDEAGNETVVELGWDVR